MAVAFIVPEQKEVIFENVTESLRAILPIFGAHPLSNLFNEYPILLVEGEDDERIWQQALRSSQGTLKLFPCSVNSITQLNIYENKVHEILRTIYDSAIAFSLRDQDDSGFEISDVGPVKRMKLGCRTAENLILTDDVLNKLNVSWESLKERIDKWLETNSNHAHFTVMSSFKEGNYDRKMFDIKIIRIDLMGLLESNKPWEVVVGQAIANIQLKKQPSPDSLQDFLGQN